MNDEVIMIPIAEIHILNPRHRDQKKFEVIVNSIKTLGLKMPITVSLRAENEPAGPKYDLVCGQGRMEAFIALGHLEIPAIVVEITKEERLIRSLVENIARRYPSTMDLIREIERLRGRRLQQPSNQRETGYIRHDGQRAAVLEKGGRRAIAPSRARGENSVVGRHWHFQSGHAGDAARTAESLRGQTTELYVPPHGQAPD